MENGRVPSSGIDKANQLASTNWPDKYRVRIVPGANRKVIGDRLKEMEQHGLINRTVLSERPISVDYSLKQLGKDSLAVLKQLQRWINSNEL